MAIDPSFATLNHEGYGWRDWLIRMPAAAIVDDLKEPSIWSQLQKSPKALRRHDHLYIVANDESWVAEVIVADATHEAATLTKPRISRLEARTKQLFDDGTYRVNWFGNGFAVERCADGMRMTQLVMNEALAERDLVRLYPRAT